MEIKLKYSCLNLAGIFVADLAALKSIILTQMNVLVQVTQRKWDLVFRNLSIPFISSPDDGGHASGIMKHKRTRCQSLKVALSLACLGCLVVNAQATNVAIGEIIDTGITLQDGTVINGSLVSGGIGAHSSQSGDFGPGIDVGGVFDGQIFTNTTTGDPDTVTRLQVSSTETIDIDVGSGEAPFENFIGFHINFSNSTSFYDVIAFDIDASGVRTLEWTTVFAFNGSTLVSPTINLASPTELTVGSETAPATFQSTINGVTTSGSPTVPVQLEIVSIPATATELTNVDPDNFAHQAQFDFGGQDVTDVFFFYGLASDSNPLFDSGRRSGFTGISIEQPPSSIPEPGSGLLILLGLGAILRRSRKL